MWEANIRAVSGEIKFFDINRMYIGEDKPLCKNWR